MICLGGGKMRTAFGGDESVSMGVARFCVDDEVKALME